MKKISVIFSLSLLLISSAFSVPGGPSGGHGKPGSPEGGRPPAPPKGPAPSRPQGPGPDGSRPPEKRSVRNHYGKSENIKYNDRTLLDNKTENFRGQRKVQDDSLLEVKKTDFVTDENGKTTVTIHFNKSINPLSVSQEKILIDGNSSDADLEFQYNKKVDSITICVHGKEISTLEIFDIESFDGNKLELLKVNLKEN